METSVIFHAGKKTEVFMNPAQAMLSGILASHSCTVGLGVVLLVGRKQRKFESFV